MIRIESFIYIAYLMVFLIVNPQTEKEQDKSTAPVLKSLFTSKDQKNVSCYRIPSIVTAPNGDLIVAVDERVPSCGDLKWNNDINIVIRRSTDGGFSWSEIETVVDYPKGQSASDPSMIVDKITGEIFLFFNYMDLNNEKDIYYFKVIKSNDNGHTWSQPQNITSQITNPDWHNDFKFITSGKGIQLTNGNLLHTIVNVNNGLHLFESDNHGNSWHLIDTPIKPGDESKIVELADGSWMINSRVNDAGFRYVHRSSDRGAKWISSPDSTLIDPGCNASIIRYTSIKNGDDKNRLLFSNIKMKDKRSNLTIRISYDEGKSWTEGKTIYNESAAYSSMSILDNNDIGLLFEKDNYNEIVFTRLTLEWLTDGIDNY